MLFLMLFLGSALLFSCKKDSPAATVATDQRDKFVGTWKGNQTINIPDLNVNNTDLVNEVFSKSSSSQNQIIIDGTQTANVNNNSYTYNEFTQVVNDPSLGDIVIIVNGTGTANGSNITESGVLYTVIQGVTYNGTWSSNLVKQ